jgi:hypothetical protein
MICSRQRANRRSTGEPLGASYRCADRGPQTKCATFSEAFGIPAPNAPRFFGVARFEEVGLHGRPVALPTVDVPLVRVP